MYVYIYIQCIYYVFFHPWYFSQDYNAFLRHETLRVAVLQLFAEAQERLAEAAEAAEDEARGGKDVEVTRRSRGKCVENHRKSMGNGRKSMKDPRKSGKNDGKSWKIYGKLLEDLWRIYGKWLGLGLNNW